MPASIIVFVLAIYGVIAFFLAQCQSFAWKFMFALDVSAWKCFFIGLVPVIGQVLNGAGLVVWLLFA